MLPVMPVAVGEKAPDFVLKDQNNQAVRLSDFRAHRPVLLVFYPLAFTGVCEGELHSLSSVHSAQVLTISVDSVYAHKVWADREGFSVPLLADFWPHGSVATAYGVFNATRGYAERGTFTVGLSGIVRFAAMVPASSSRDASVWEAALASVVRDRSVTS
jgi:peroxiredoxin (alkyl hydroperoxide reductase subunit C)